jgi:hypothetical protein
MKIYCWSWMESCRIGAQNKPGLISPVVGHAAHACMPSKAQSQISYHFTKAHLGAAPQTLKMLNRQQ